MSYKILGTPTTLDQLAQLPAPAHTATWKPLAFHAVVTFLLGMFERHGLTVESAEYGLNKTRQRFIGMFAFDGGSDALVPSLMLRGCYDKAWAWNVIIGGQFTVCQNGIFDGNGIHVLRKNTINVWSDFRALMSAAVADIMPSYQRVSQAAESLKAIPVNERRGAALIGVARYEGLLTANQETVVMQDWRKARHAEFSARSLFSLYNCGTEGLKKGAFDNAGERHVGWHEFMMDFARTEGERLAARPALPAATVTPAPAVEIIPASAQAALAHLRRG
jgi:hypothetical protein